MVRQGVALGLLTQAIARRYPELVAASDEPITSMGLWLLTHSDLRDSARVRCFMQFLAEQNLPG